MLKDLLTGAPRTEPLIRLYPTYISFNSAAVGLLDLDRHEAVAIQQDDRDGYVYVAGCDSLKQTYGLRRRCGTFVLSNAPLCRKLAECLEGYGAYRICQGESIEFMGQTFYNIFKKKYGKD